MPIYVYSCHTCELELEELHPMGKAPPHSIGCPLCGGLFTRDVANFRVNVGRAAPMASDPKKSASVEDTPARSIDHGANCFCCAPRRSRR